MTSFLVDREAKTSYTVKYIHQGGLCGGHRSLHTDNQVPRTPACDQLTYLGTLRREPGESCIKLLGVRSIQRVQWLHRLQRPSMASMTFNGFKEVQRLQGVQRGSKTFKGAGWDWGSRSKEKSPGSTTIKMERSTGVLQKCNTFCCDVADVQQWALLWYYSMWVSDTAWHNIL